MSTTTFTVKGMTCGHCVNHVTEEVKKIDGVSEVAVDLESGAVTVTADAEITSIQMKTAVVEAGYELVK